MSERIAVFGQLLSTLGQGPKAVTDNDWARIAQSEELTELLQDSIKRIVGDERDREHERHVNMQRVLSGRISNIAKVGSQVVIQKSVIDHLKGKGLPGSVNLVRELIELTREELRERGLTNIEIHQLETALREVNLHLRRTPLIPPTE